MLLIDKWVLLYSLQGAQSILEEGTCFQTRRWLCERPGAAQADAIINEVSVLELEASVRFLNQFPNWSLYLSALTSW